MHNRSWWSEAWSESYTHFETVPLIWINTQLEGKQPWFIIWSKNTSKESTDLQWSRKNSKEGTLWEWDAIEEEFLSGLNIPSQKQNDEFLKSINKAEHEFNMNMLDSEQSTRIPSKWSSVGGYTGTK